MNKYIVIAAFALMAMPLAAQETYENTKLAETDLNGTARYVGMGGAMDALGADLSTINTNPAGIGLFRSSMGSISAGVVSQSGKNLGSDGKTSASFDQVGFVYSMKNDRAFLNFAFNYHKSSNFNNILSAAGVLDGASQNKLSFMKAMDGYDTDGSSLFNTDLNNNHQLGLLDNLYYSNFNVGDDGYMYYNDASGYNMYRKNSGYIGEYDFNFSGNLNDRFYWGVTFGLHSVNYKGVSAYTENIMSGDASFGTVTVADERRISGTGFDVKLGAIFRPMKNSPFRIGAYIQTPTWYDLTSSNRTVLFNDTGISTINENGNIAESDDAYSFKVYTPWKFGINFGHTVGNYLALGATVEYADYGSIDTRVNEEGSYDSFSGTYNESSYSDDNMNEHTSQMLKGVVTVKLGAEYKPITPLSLRIGYNYLSPMFGKNSYKDGSIDSYGSLYSTATDYVNWGATNRFTAGVGYNFGKFGLDLAYVYNTTSGEFHPFMDSYTNENKPFTYYNDNNQLVAEDLTNYGYPDGTSPIKVTNNRHQLILTASYRF